MSTARAAVPDTRVAVEESPPVACFGSLGQVSFAEGSHAVVGDSFGGKGVVDKGFEFVAEVAEITLDFNKVLFGTAGDQQVMVVLDEL